MKLFEILRQDSFTYPYKRVSHNTGRYAAIYQFNADSSLVEVRFAIFPIYVHPIYAKYFADKKRDDLEDMQMGELQSSMADIGGSYVVSFTVDGKFDITGAGLAIPIFATTIKIIEEFIFQSKARELVFTAKEPSRVKFYDRLVTNVVAGTNLVRVGNETGMYHLIDRSLI